MRLEIGAGEYPDEGYDLHADVLALPGVDLRSRMDRLPFADGALQGLRAYHVLEHQSWELVPDTLREWVRVLEPGAEVDIGVPDARCRAADWLAGKISTLEANYWILGGHSDNLGSAFGGTMPRQAYQGVDERGVPRWFWNAHHALFDPDWLRELLEAAGLVDVDVRPEDTCNLRCRARRGPIPATLVRSTPE